MKKIKVKMYPLNELGKKKARELMLKLLMKSSDFSPIIIQAKAMSWKENAEAGYKVARECYEEICEYVNQKKDFKTLLEELKKEFHMK